MPPSGERVNPVPLSGAELKRIITADLQQIMDRDCVLTGVSAFGQVSYEITVKLHFQNLSFPESQVKAVSREATETELAADPARVNLQGPPPLEGDGETVAVERHREIDSPTQARVEFGIPVPIVRQPAQGRAEETTAKYPQQSVPPGKVRDADITADTKVEFAERKRKRGRR